MKNIFIFIFIFLLSFGFAQHISKDVESALRDKDYPKLKEVMQKENINLQTCYKQESIFIKIIALNNTELFQLAINDADVNATCGDKSPLMYAVLAFNEVMVKALLEKNANKEAVSKEGFTAKHYAEKTQHKPVIDLLQ